MSTRGAIIQQLPDGTYRGVYCHSDSYESGVGQTLLDHYSDPVKISALIDLGSLSCLYENVAPSKPGHHFDYDRQEPGVTVAYMRDLGEEDCEPSVGPTEELCAAKIGHDGHIYCFRSGKWTHNAEDLESAINAQCADEEDD